MKDRSFNSFASHVITLSGNKAKWSSLLARTRALILFISIWIFDSGPEKLRDFRETGHSTWNPESTAWNARIQDYFVFPYYMGRCVKGRWLDVPFPGKFRNPRKYYNRQSQTLCLGRPARRQHYFVGQDLRRQSSVSSLKALTEHGSIDGSVSAL